MTGAEPFSPKDGDLETYLREYEDEAIDNLFHGSEYFFVMRDKNLLIPGVTTLRVDQSPAPDILYVVNKEYQLRGPGRGTENMSAVGAKEGTYDPSIALKEQYWSIHSLKLWENL